ncbi:MAG: polyphosphate kinase 1 [Myxococcota bacterium]
MKLDGPDRFLNRELSWLAFNERVLALAADSRLALLERAKFIAIFASNLDEFFQVRVAGLKEQLAAGIVAASPDGRSPSEQLVEIQAKTTQLIRTQQQLLKKEILPALSEEGLRIVGWKSLSPRDRKHLRSYYDAQIQPALTPLAVDPAHPFPWISNLSLNLGMLVLDESSGLRRFARVKVPGALPRLVPLEDGERWLPLEQLIATQIDDLFPGMKVLSSHSFRVTRDAALLIDEGEADDLLSAIQSGLHRRLRVNDAVRIEIEKGMSDEIRNLLVDELELSPLDVYTQNTLLDATCLWQLYGVDRPELKEESWRPRTQKRLSGVTGDEDSLSIFEELRRGDVMVHHPYDSFATSMEAFLEKASRDPDVVAIKHTLYRTAGSENRVVRALIHAAQAGKEVVALVELKARFDEQSNIEWARNLEAAGVNVVYGMVGLKTHGKVVLVIRREADGLRRYCHIGTGNYNPETARIYEDIGLLTASEEIGAEVGQLFNYMTGYSDPVPAEHLLLAPDRLRGGLLERIAETASKPGGRITIKVNGLSDPEVIEALYKASQAGTQIDLLVRGICCLRPGQKNLSENIRVRSVVGRFLEHSRVFRFVRANGEEQLFVGSADLMTRNLDGRIEVLTPILDESLAVRVREILAVSLAPKARAWELQADGTWVETPSGEGFDVHRRLQELANKH